MAQGLAHAIALALAVAFVTGRSTTPMTLPFDAVLKRLSVSSGTTEDIIADGGVFRIDDEALCGQPGQLRALLRSLVRSALSERVHHERAEKDRLKEVGLLRERLQNAEVCVRTKCMKTKSNQNQHGWRWNKQPRGCV